MAPVYTRASYCKRGHWISWDIASERADYCKKCGASAVEGCPACGAPILGLEVDPSVVFLGSGPGDARPAFCTACGAPFPWVGRQGRIHQLQNLLDRQQLDAATELAVREQLDVLARADLDPGEERKGWERVKKLSPGLWDSGRAIIETVVSATIRQQLGV